MMGVVIMRRYYRSTQISLKVFARMLFLLFLLAPLQAYSHGHHGYGGYGYGHHGYGGYGYGHHGYGGYGYGHHGYGGYGYGHHGYGYAAYGLLGYGLLGLGLGYGHHHDEYHSHSNYGYGGHTSYGHYPYHGHDYTQGHHDHPYSHSLYSGVTHSPHDSVYSGNHQQAVREDYGLHSRAWGLFSQGKSRAALDVFASEAENHPRSGIPKTGYALATASLGDLNRGVWAMRRAFRIDPHALTYLNLDKPVLVLVDTLIEKYRYPLGHKDKRPDEAFMVGALSYIRHDYSAANLAIARAVADGDNSASLTNLRRLVQEQSAAKIKG